MSSLKRKFQKKYTVEQAAEMLMQSSDDSDDEHDQSAMSTNQQLVDSDDSIVSTSSEDVSCESEDSDSCSADVDIESFPPPFIPPPIISPPTVISPIRNCNTEANYIDLNISSFSGDSAIPSDIFPGTSKSSFLLNHSKNDGKNDVSDSGYIWTADTPIIPKFQFNENVGLTIEMPTEPTPADFLKLFYSDELITEICISTNLYANCVICSTGPLRRRSIWNKWKPVTNDDIRKFIGLIIHMGLVNMPTFKHYWKKDRLFRNESIPTVMSRERFQLIMRFLHFGNNPNFLDDRLGKVRLMLNHFNDTMSEIYVPGKDLSLDESMMLYRGRLVFRQYIKNKRHKYGVKYFELCTKDGLILRTSIYSGQDLDTEKSLGKTANVVLDLTKEFLGKGYHLYTDSYYNSVPLTKYLTENGTYISGTLRKDRVDNPKMVTTRKLKKGQFIWAGTDETTVTKWKDKREVLVISNAHIPEMVESANRNGKLKFKPNIVKDYNDGMSGVDRADQMMSYNSVMRKSSRWNKKVGIHIMEMMVHNAHFLFKSNQVAKYKMTCTEFKQHTVRWLVGETTIPSHLKPGAEFHYLHRIPSKIKTNPIRQCVFCKSKGLKRKESRYICAYCDDQPALCLFPCFVEYHVALGIASHHNN